MIFRSVMVLLASCSFDSSFRFVRALGFLASPSVTVPDVANDILREGLAEGGDLAFLVEKCSDLCVRMVDGQGADSFGDRL